MNELAIGAGILEGPAPMLDEHYNVRVYPATIEKAVMDIFVPMHGRIDLTIHCLESLYNFTQAPFHLIAADDSPPADYGLTEQYIRQMQKERNNITYCHSNVPWKTGNLFFNIGLKYSKTDYLATVMNSMTVEPAWEITALDLMKRDSLIGSIGFKCLFPNGLIESAGIAFAGHIPTDIGRDQPGYRCNEVRDAEAVQWAFALHRKAALVGNLDEDVFLGHVGWDDIDNCLVLKSKGWKILYCGQGTGIHQPRATRGSNSQEAALKNQKNSHTFFKRWGLWDKYLEATKMDVGSVLKYDTKAKLGQSVTKIQVLQSYVKEAEREIQAQVNEALKELGVSPDQYLLEMNPQTNTWLLKTNAQAVMAKQVTEATPVEAVKPAGDTENKAEVENTVALPVPM